MLHITHHILHLIFYKIGTLIMLTFYLFEDLVKKKKKHDAIVAEHIEELPKKRRRCCEDQMRQEILNENEMG